MTQLYAIYKKLPSNIIRANLKEWKKMYHANTNRKEKWKN